MLYANRRFYISSLQAPGKYPLTRKRDSGNDIFCAQFKKLEVMAWVGHRISKGGENSDAICSVLFLTWY